MHVHYRVLVHLQPIFETRWCQQRIVDREWYLEARQKGKAEDKQKSSHVLGLKNLLTIDYWKLTICISIIVRTVKSCLHDCAPGKAVKHINVYHWSSIVWHMGHWVHALNLIKSYYASWLKVSIHVRIDWRQVLTTLKVESEADRSNLRDATNFVIAKCLRWPERTHPGEKWKHPWTSFSQ